MIYTANRNDHHAMLILGYQVITLQPPVRTYDMCVYVKTNALLSVCVAIVLTKANYFEYLLSHSPMHDAKCALNYIVSGF
jgi:hypothetical protein